MSGRVGSWNPVLRMAMALTIAVVLVPVSFLVYRHMRDAPHRMESERLMQGQPVGAPFESGRVVIERLTAYRSAKGRFPDGLDDLVPEWLDAVPPPGWGANAWQYTSDGDHFGLSVKRDEKWYYGFYYNDERGSWIYDY